MNHKMRLGPIAIFLVVVAIILTTLATLTLATTNADKVMAAWMSSEGHRANILRAFYGSIGVACLQVNGVFCWVQLFGK